MAFPTASKVLPKLPGPVVVDFMHGAGAETAAEVFSGKNVVTLRDRHDPLFGGVAPEPVEKNLQPLVDEVKRRKALFGVALDGDADRFALVSDKGQYMTPCQTGPLLLEYLLSKGQYKGKIVQAVSMGFLTKRIALMQSWQKKLYDGSIVVTYIGDSPRSMTDGTVMDTGFYKNGIMGYWEPANCWLKKK